MDRVALLARGHGVSRARAVWIAAGWLLAMILCRIGIPPVDPTVLPTPRPLETLGTLAICLPVSLHASLLRDHSRWLTDTAAHPVRVVRLPWLALVTLGAAAGAAAWVTTLPAAVPRAHAAGVCALAYGLSLCSVRLLTGDLATALPMLAVGVCTWGNLVPFDRNVVYNVSLTHGLWICALACCAGGSVLVGRWGAREPGAVG